MNNARLHFGGLPTEPDVKRLMDAFPHLAPGEVVSYSRIGELIGAKWPTARFRTVLRAWQKELFDERNIDTGPVPREGVRILPPMEREKASRGNARQGARKWRKAAVRADSIDTQELGPQDKARVEHTRRLTEMVCSVVQKSVRQLAVVKPIEGLPKLPAGSK